MRTGLHPYSLSQPPPLLPKLMDKLGVELVLIKSIRIQVYTCSNVLRGHACNFTGHRTGRVQLELVEVKSMRALKCPEGQHCSPQGTALDEFSLDSSWQKVSTSYIHAIRGLRKGPHAAEFRTSSVHGRSALRARLAED